MSTKISTGENLEFECSIDCPYKAAVNTKFFTFYSNP